MLRPSADLKCSDVNIQHYHFMSSQRKVTDLNKKDRKKSILVSPFRDYLIFAALDLSELPCWQTLGQCS